MSDTSTVLVRDIIMTCHQTLTGTVNEGMKYD